MPANGDVRHAELFALVDVRRAAVQVQHRGRASWPTRTRCSPSSPNRRHRPRLVVVVPVEAVPADVGQARLPAAEDRLEVAQVERPQVPLAARPGRGRRARTGTPCRARARAGSVNRRASSTVTPGISPTVSSVGAGRRSTSRCISCRNSWMPRAADEVRRRRRRTCRRRGTTPSGSAASLEIMLMTSMRKPSTPAVEPPAHHLVDRRADLAGSPS